MNQLFDTGNIIIANDQELECVSVSYQEVNGEREKFVYGFQLKSDMDAYRESLKAEQEDEDFDEEVETKPEEPKEETQYVR